MRFSDFLRNIHKSRVGYITVTISLLVLFGCSSSNVVKKVSKSFSADTIISKDTLIWFHGIKGETLFDSIKLNERVISSVWYNRREMILAIRHYADFRDFTHYKDYLSSISGDSSVDIVVPFFDTTSFRVWRIQITAAKYTEYINSEKMGGVYINYYHMPLIPLVKKDIKVMNRDRIFLFPMRKLLLDSVLNYR